MSDVAMASSALPHPDTMIRIALCCFLTALDSGLSPEQQDWLRTRLLSRDPFTPAELAKLTAPLLAWGTRQGFAEDVIDRWRLDREVAREADYLYEPS